MFSIIAALTQAGGVIIDKIVLTRRQVELRVFIPVLFLFLFITTGLAVPFLTKIDPRLFTPYYLILFAAMLVLAVLWNIFYYKGAQAEKVHDFELIVLTQPLVTIILAAVFLKSEQHWSVVSAAVIASIALIFAQIKKEHFEFSRESWGLVAAVILMSAELIIIKLLLNVLSPVALYFARTVILFLFFWIFYRPHWGQIAPKNYGLILLTAALGTVQMVTKFYAFENVGIVYTSLILILSPILVYFVSKFFLHENINRKQTFAFAIILLCVIYATVFRG